MNLLRSMSALWAIMALAACALEDNALNELHEKAEKARINVTGVSLNTTMLKLALGEEATLIATIQPANAWVMSTRWESGDTAIATVNNGRVTAVGTGVTSVLFYVVTWAQYGHMVNMQSSCEIIVEDNFTINITQLEDLALVIEGPTLRITGSAEETTKTITLSNSEQYYSIRWLFGGEEITYGETITLSSSTYNMAGTYFITVEVYKDGRYYSKIISFTVEL